MTNREFYTAIMEAETVTEEMKDFAAAAIEKLDATNVKRTETAAKKRAEKDAEKEPIRAALLAALTDEPKTATMLIEETGLEIKPQSVPSLMKPLVEAGTVEKVDVKVPKKGTQRGYVKA